MAATVRRIAGSQWLRAGVQGSYKKQLRYGEKALDIPPEKTTDLDSSSSCRFGHLIECIHTTVSANI